MAKRSNKTAHVLNLLAGHDASKEAEEQTPAAGDASADTAAQAAQKAPGGAAAQPARGGASGQAVSAGAAPVSAGQAAAAPASSPAPAPVVSGPNNIAMIDKTEEDPVAELIQQKLSSEFEKQMQQASSDILIPDDAEPLADTISPDAPIEMDTAAPAADTDDTLSADMDLDILLASDAEEIEAPAEETLIDETLIQGTPTQDSPMQKTPTQDSPMQDSPMQEAPMHNTAAPVQNTRPEPVPTQERTAPPQMDTPSAHEAVPQPVQAQESISAPQMTVPPAHEAAPQPVRAQESTSAPQMTAPSKSEAQSSPVQDTAPAEEIPEPEEDFAAVNVMEHIVNDKIIYFMRQFDVCTCSRCKADVIALTLNGLRPKYIVTMKAAVDPLLSYYTNRLISDVTVEATKACITVKDNPRH